MSNADQPKEFVPSCPRDFVVVGLIGPSDSGNEQLASRIKRAYKETRILRFADLLQEAVIEEGAFLSAIDPKLAEEAYAVTLLDGVQAAGRYLQKKCNWWPALLHCIEREFVLKSDGMYWVDLMLERMITQTGIGILDFKAKLAGKPLVIVPDVQCQLQAELIHKFKGINFKILADNQPAQSPEQPNLPGEIKPALIHGTIDNTKDFEQAYCQLRDAINKFEEAS